MLLMEESWRVLFEAKAFQERAWLEARMRVKMEEMQSLILDEVEWKMHSLMKQFIEQERRAGPGVNSSGYMSWTMSPGVRVSPEDGARLERWQREEEELRERRRKLWEAKPSVSLQQVEVKQTPAQDLQLTDAHLRKAREGLAEEWKTIENEKKKMERWREIRERTEKLEKEQLQEETKALEKEWKNIEKEKRKIKEEREELEKKAKAQEEQLEMEEKRLESEAREREEALRKKALADEQEREKIELERKKVEAEQKEVKSQKEQLLQEKTKLKEKVVRERRTVATDKKRLKDEWEKVEDERRRVEKERKDLEQKEEELHRAEEINKKQREYEPLMKEMEKEKQKIETTRKKMMKEKTQRGNKAGEKKSDEVKQKTEITETAIKEEKADEVDQGKTEEANVHDDSWDSDESNQEESSQPKAKSNIALMKAVSQRSAQENEDDSPWDSDEEVATPRNTKAARAPIIPKATVPLKSGNASKVPVKNTCTQKQSKASSDAQVVDELEEIEKELQARPGNGKSTAATSIKKATVPVKQGSVCSAPVKKNVCAKIQSKTLNDADLFDKELEELEKELATGPSNKKATVATNVPKATIPVKQGNPGSVPIKKNPYSKKQSKGLVDPDLFDKELEELEQELAAGPSNSKPTASTTVQRAAIPVKHGNTSSAPVKTTTCAKKQSKALDGDDSDFSDDLFDTDLQEKKTIKKSVKEDEVDTDAIVRELERLNYEFREPKGRTMSSYERKSKDSPNKSISKAMTGNKPTDVNANEAQNRKPNTPLFPQDAIHLKYLKGRRF